MTISAVVFTSTVTGASAGAGSALTLPHSSMIVAAPADDWTPVTAVMIAIMNDADSGNFILSSANSNVSFGLLPDPKSDRISGPLQQQGRPPRPRKGGPAPDSARQGRVNTISWLVAPAPPGVNEPPAR